MLKYFYMGYLVSPLLNLSSIIEIESRPTNFGIAYDTCKSIYKLIAPYPISGST